MTTERKIEVLVVDDSPVARLLLVHVLERSPRLHVMGTAGSGAEALAWLEHRSPDAIVMDVHMPGLDGYETTRRIMATSPVPIVICSAEFDPAEVANTFRALDAGALAATPKPVGPEHPDYESAAARLIEAVVLMSEVRVVKRWTRARRLPALEVASNFFADVPQILAIGTSTGGPPVLRTLLAGLPKTFPIPVLIVQHIASGFLPGFVAWLGETTGFSVQIAAHDQVLQPGQAYLAPDGFHMGVAAGGRIVLSRLPPENGLRPAVSFLFRSVAAVYGARAIAVLLTGMGKDGAEELKQLNDLGAITVAQDEESSVVHGMPGEAIRLGAAAHVMAPEKMPAAFAGWAAPAVRDLRPFAGG